MPVVSFRSVQHGRTHLQHLLLPLLIQIERRSEYDGTLSNLAQHTLESPRLALARPDGHPDSHFRPCRAVLRSMIVMSVRQLRQLVSNLVRSGTYALVKNCTPMCGPDR